MGLRTLTTDLLIHALTRGVVRTGPFRGMKYGLCAFGSALSPKLLGTYEMELRDAVAELIAWRPELCVDAGAAEGYYLAGLALAMPACRFVGFEMEERGRALLRRMVARNGVADRTEIRGACDAAALAQVLPPGRRAAVVMDIEGGEKDVLDPGRVPGLAEAVILVELHEVRHPDLAAVMTARFTRTHTIRTCLSRARVPADFPVRTAWLTDRWRLRAMDEKRGAAMRWMLLLPRG